MNTCQCGADQPCIDCLRDNVLDEVVERLPKIIDDLRELAVDEHDPVARAADHLAQLATMAVLARELVTVTPADKMLIADVAPRALEMLTALEGGSQ